MQLADLKYIAEILVDEGEIDYLKLTNALKDLKEKLLSIGIDDISNRAHQEDIQLNSGIALGTYWAVLCIDDMMRTKRFIQGLYQAVRDVQKVKHTPVNVLYAGTGPYATLALPIMAILSPNEIQFTLLEVNEISFSYLTDVIEKLELSRYVTKLANKDATAYQIDDPESIDIILSETMQSGLLNEQQVPICYNLVRQAPKETILIPSSIDLNLCLVNATQQHQFTLGESTETYYRELGTFFNLSSRSINESNQVKDFDRKHHFESKQFEFPKDAEHYNRLSVFTQIKIYKESLKPSECALTTPIILKELDKIDKLKTIDIHYCVSESPSIEFKLR